MSAAICEREGVAVVWRAGRGARLADYVCPCGGDLRQERSGPRSGGVRCRACHAWLDASEPLCRDCGTCQRCGAAATVVAADHRVGLVHDCRPPDGVMPAPDRVSRFRDWAVLRPAGRAISEDKLLAYDRPRCPYSGCGQILARDFDGRIVAHDHTDDSPESLEDRPRGDY